MAGKVTRSERRQREAKVKALWRRRLGNVRRWDPKSSDKSQVWEEWRALLLAHHNKCPCGLCSLKFPGPKRPGVRRKRWDEDD